MIKNGPWRQMELSCGETGTWECQKIDIQRDTRVTYKTGEILDGDSFYLAGMRAGIPAGILADVYDLLAFEMDFERDVRAGQHFYVLYEENYASEKMVDTGHVLAVSFEALRGNVQMYRFVKSDGGVGYYDEHGNGAIKSLKRTPINNAKITSSFSGRRKHPVLGFTRAHKGVDFRAPTGTPIPAAGAGRVVARSFNRGHGNFVKIRHNGTFETLYADVAGIDSEKQELMEVVDFLKNQAKFKALGARVPRGILLSGEPGTGKTLLARAVAGEANVPFFATSGSDFSGIIVGLGVAKIKEIFELAKRNAPCILFIDEIDAIGQSRSKHSLNDNDREQTLNQLLIEMDGFANDTGIIVIAATNRPDMLDAALLRPGRFDRQINIELPNLEGRREILDLHAKKFKIGESVNMMDVARGTTGFSGADLENLLNEAALHAVRSEHKVVEQSDVEEARDKILMGPKKNRKMRPEDIKLTAYHEAGHAFVSLHYKDITDPIHKATIIPRGEYTDIMDFTKNASVTEQTAFWKGFRNTVEKLNLNNNFRTVANTGRGSGQSVMHFHIHIMSDERFQEDF